MGDQDKNLAPHFCCVTCLVSRDTDKMFTLLPFASPMIYWESTDHVSDCYFCLTSTTGVTAKSRHIIQNPNLPSAMRPVPHSAELPVPKPPTNMTVNDSGSSDEYVGQSTKLWIVIQHLLEPVLQTNHACWLIGTWMISSAIWTCQRSKLNF